MFKELNWQKSKIKVDLSIYGTANLSPQRSVNTYIGGNGIPNCKAIFLYGITILWYVCQTTTWLNYSTMHYLGMM